MEKFLNSKGIELVEYYSEGGFTTCYAYNQDLLDKNVLIECYNADLGTEPENPEVETVVFIHTIEDDTSYSFTMFYEYGIDETAPIQIFRIITDLVEYISICNDDSIINDLTAIAKGVTSSLDWESEIGQAETYDAIAAKFQYIRERLD